MFYPIKGSHTPSPNGIAENQRDIKEIRLTAPVKDGPDYSSLYAMIPSHFHKAALLGINDPSVVSSRKRFGENAGNAGMDWTEIKAKVQECYDKGKLQKWCSSAEAAQQELEKIWRYWNAAQQSRNPNA